MNRLKAVEVGWAMIDEDPGASQPAELANSRVLKQSGSLTLMTHKDPPQRRLIVVSPRLEEWLYARAAVLGVTPMHYGLPRTAAELHDLPRYERGAQFVMFVERLQPDSEMQCLQKWLAGRH